MADIHFQDLVSAVPIGTDIVPIGQGTTNTRKATITDIRGVVNDLTTGGTDKTLSAEMGKQLDTKKANQTDLDTTNTNVSNLTTEITNARGGEVDLDTRMDKIYNKIGVLNESVADYDVYASVKDGSFYTVVDYKRTSDATLYLKSTLSNKDANGYFQTCKLDYYGLDGITKIKTQTWTLTYDSDGLIINKVVS